MTGESQQPISIESNVCGLNLWCIQCKINVAFTLSSCRLVLMNRTSLPFCPNRTLWIMCYLSNLQAVGLRHLVGEVSLFEACGAHPLVGGWVGPRW